MVRKSELHDTSAITKVIAEAIAGAMKDAGVTQNQLADGIGKSQSYVSTRYRGEQAWTTDDIDAIAKVLGLSNGFALLDLARGIAREKPLMSVVTKVKFDKNGKPVIGEDLERTLSRIIASSDGVREIRFDRVSAGDTTSAPDHETDLRVVLNGDFHSLKTSGVNLKEIFADETGTLSAKSNIGQLAAPAHA